MPKLSVREIEEKDIPLIIEYWTGSSDEHMKAMGVDIAKLPTASQWNEMLPQQLQQDYNEKKAYATIWLVDDKPVGHCNVNQIVFGDSAHMHLHLWSSDSRRKGIGQQLVLQSLPFFFENLQLETLYCQPFADNPAPNKTLERVGFTFEKTYRATPGYINFEQDVNLWFLTKDAYQNITSR